MRYAEAILTAALALSSAGCVLRGKPQTAVATPPPAPKPVTPPAPAPPPEPLSVPQTHAELPAPQPISAEAIASMQLPEEPPLPPPAPKPPRRSSTTPAGPPRAENPASAATTTPAVTTPAANAEPERAPIQEILSAAERQRLQDEAGSRRREIQQRLDQIRGRHLDRQERALKDLITSFVRMSEEAEKRGDVRKASELAERGQVLARELASGK